MFSGVIARYLPYQHNTKILRDSSTGPAIATKSCPRTTVVEQGHIEKVDTPLLSGTVRNARLQRHYVGAFCRDTASRRWCRQNSPRGHHITASTPPFSISTTIAHQQSLKLRISQSRLQPLASRYPLSLIRAHLPLLLLPVFSSPSPLISTLTDTHSGPCLFNGIIVASVVLPRISHSRPLRRACLVGILRRIQVCSRLHRQGAFPAARRIATGPALVQLVAGQRAVGSPAPGAAVF